MLRTIANILSTLGFLSATLCPAANARAQSGQPRSDSLWSVELKEMVVTATRTPRSLERVPTPTRVFMADEAEARGALRVSDFLSETAGLRIVRNQFGAGLQMRGLDPAYTLILLDGQPIVARTNGTIDLDRIPGGLVERIEVVKGPSSSLYGSEALGGVVNIITRSTPQRAWADLDMSRATHQTIDLSGAAGGARGPWRARVLGNRFESAGYDLAGAVPGTTAGAFVDNSLGGTLGYRGSGSVSGRATARFSHLVQSIGSVGSSPDEVDRKAGEASAELSARLKSGLRIRTALFAGLSRNSTTLLEGNSATTSDFQLAHYKWEGQSDWLPSSRQHLTVGAGLVAERIRGTRIAGDNRQATSGFAFAGHEFIGGDGLQTSVSLRFDAHEGYGSRLSPKMAVLWSWADTRLRASVGSGFKAPTFQQLFLDFTNPGPGYSVVGTRDLEATLERFDQAGQIAYLLGSVGDFGALRPEKAWTVELGLDGNVTARGRVQASAYGTWLRDMIETQPVAAKPNGQFLFSYANLRRVRIRGAEMAADYQLSKTLSANASYQYLQAQDLDVLQAIEDGLLFRRVDGRDIRLSRSEYGGLFNRSPHSASAGVAFDREALSLTVRAIYRHRYGFGDLNGNLVLDEASEYAPGHALFNATISIQASTHARAQLTVENLTDRIYPTTIPSLSGRIIRVGIHVKTNP